MQGTLQNRLPSLAAVWRLLHSTQIRLFSVVAVSALLSFLLVGEAIAQESGTIRGTVNDATNGESLPGANVVIVGTQQGAATNAQGNYTIQGIEPGTYSVRASFLGYQETVREGIEVRAGETTTVNFTLQQQEQALDELVVVGYGEQQREEVTGSIAEVSSEDLEDIQATGPQEVLQGVASGVSVTDNPAPGEGARVRIRGLNTLNNNNPLYVVDGVPVGGLQAVNPSNIESIEVLKDASAAAIYGSRASSGVVLITTKEGEPGDIRVDFSTSYGVQNSHQRLDLMNTEEYLEWAREMQNAGNQDPPAPSYSTDRSVNWQDEVMQQGYLTNTNLAVSGGTEDATYRLSLGYTDEKGTVIETGFERYSLRANSSFNIGRFTLSENLAVSYRKSRPVRNGGFLGLAQRMPPYIPVRDTSNLGGYAGTNSPDLADDQNPVRVQKLGYDRSNEVSIIGNVTGQVDIVKGVNLKTVLGMDYDQAFGETFTPPFSTGNQWGQGDAAISEDRAYYFSPVSTTTLNVNQSVGDHQIGGTAGFEVSNDRFKDMDASGQNPLTDQIRVIGSVDPETVNLGGSEGEDVLVSYFGRVNYNYDGRYLLEGSLRRDGYSRFGPDNKYGLFPSVSAGWNIHREAFMEGLPLSRLKLRGSWGLTGNNNAIGRYEWQSTISTDYKYNFNGTAVTPADIEDLSNAALQWEQVEMINAGLDLGFLDNAVTLSAEYYQNTTEDILLGVPLPGSYGFSGGTRANTGDVESSGFEFTLGLENPSSGDFNWSVDANFATSSNEMVDLGLANEFFAQDWGTGTWSANRVQEGFPLYHFWGFKVDRLFQPSDFKDNGELKDGIPTQSNAAPGDIKFVNIDGDDDIDAQDRTNLGTPHPSFSYGLTASAQYNNFDLSVSLQGQGGNKIVKSYAFWTQGQTRVFNHEDIVLDRWSPNNTDATVPRAITGDPNENARMSDRFVADGDYMRVQRVTLGYTLPLESIGWGDRVRRARIYVQSKNLYTLTGYEGYDPEVYGGGGDSNVGFDEGDYIPARSFLIGAQFNF